MDKKVTVMKQDEKTEIKLDIEKLENLFMDIFNYIQMPIRRSQLIKFPSTVFEYKNTKKQINFVLDGLIDEHKLLETKHYISTPELAEQGRSCAVPTEEGIIKYLASGNLKETIKTEIHFNPLSNLRISPRDYFKFVKSECPFANSNTAYAYLNYFERKTYRVKDCLYQEMNDYPHTNGFLTSFFSDRDSRVIIKNIREYKSKIFIQVILLPGKGSYRQAHERLEVFIEGLSSYFNKKVVYRYVPLKMTL